VADRNANTRTIGDGSTPGAPVSFSVTRGGADLDVDAGYDDGQLVESFPRAPATASVPKLDGPRQRAQACMSTNRE
jgi:hypothetical protein